jgi:hypothetical protein
MFNNQKKRKLIDISDRTGKILGMMAVQNNMSFKAYIETLLESKANEIAEKNNLLSWKQSDNAKHKTIDKSSKNG